MSIGTRIKQRREELGYTQIELAALIGVSKGTIGNYETDVSSPNETYLVRLFDVLKCSANYLYQDVLPQNSEEKADAEISAELRTISEHYNKLNDLGKSEAQKRIKELIYVPEYRIKKNLPSITEDNNTEVCEDSCDFITLKHYLNTASAGTGSFLFDTVEETLSVKDTEAARKADFVIKVSGNSMEPLYQDGDIVLVKSLPKIQIDEIGIFVKDGETFIKRLGKNCLISENKNYTPIIIHDKESVSCYGKVLGKAEVIL